MAPFDEVVPSTPSPMEDLLRAEYGHPLIWLLTRVFFWSSRKGKRGDLMQHIVGDGGDGLARGSHRSLSGQGSAEIGNETHREGYGKGMVRGSRMEKVRFFTSLKALRRVHSFGFYWEGYYSEDINPALLSHCARVHVWGFQF